MKRLLCLITLAALSGPYLRAQMQTTPNIGLLMPPPGYPNWETIMNSNMRKIDSAIIAHQVYQGTWSATVTYPLNVLVSYNGVLWVSAIANNLNNVPSAGTQWGLVVGPTIRAGAADAAITNDSSAKNLSVGGLNTFRYASQYQTGAGNNGIVNAQASLHTVIADPSYAITESPTINTFSSSPMHYHDQRVSQDIEYYRNPGTDATGALTYKSRFGMLGAFGKGIECQYDIPFGNAIDTRIGCLRIYMNQLNPGSNLGNPSVGPSGWQVASPFSISNLSYSAGLLESISVGQGKSGVGDNAAVYVYVSGQGGWPDPSGEQNKVYAAGLGEENTEYAGTANATLTNPMQLITTPISAFASGFNGNKLQGVGRYLIPRGHCTSYPTGCPAAPYTGTVSAIATGIDSGFTEAVTVSGTVPVSNAWGTLTANCNTGNPNTQPPFTNSVTCNVNILSGSLDTTHLICFEGNYHDCAIPTSSTGSSITFTLISGVGGLRKQHRSGSYWFQGGMAGYGLEFAAFTPTVSRSQPLRYLYDIFGSTDAHTLQIAYFRTGSTFVPGYPVNNANVTQFANFLPTMSSQGTTLAATNTNAGGATLTNLISGFNGATLDISNADDAALNGICTNVTFIPVGNSFTCTHAGLTGTHTNNSSTPTALIMYNGVDSNVYSAWPMAEVTDVRDMATYPITSWSITGNTLTVVGANSLFVGNPVVISGLTTGSFLNGIPLVVASVSGTQYTASLAAFPHANVSSTVESGTTSVNPPVVDGALSLEQNVLGTINRGDTLEETHGVASEWQTTSIGQTVNNMNAQWHVSSGSVGGPAICCGNNSLAANSLLYYTNLNPDSMYASGIVPPNMAEFAGPTLNGVMFDHVANGGSVVYLSPVATILNNPNFSYNLINGRAKTGLPSAFQVQPFWGDATLTTPRILNLTGAPVVINSDLGAQTFRNQVSFAAIAAPTLTVTPKTTGGTLADGTYYYKVQARGDNFYSPQSTEQICTISGGGGFGSCVLSWTAVAGANTAYYPSGRASSGGELNFLPVASGIANTQWIDNNSQTPAGTAQASTIPGINQAGQVGINSKGTANQVILKAPPNLTGNVTITLPRNSGSLGTVASGTTALATSSIPSGQCQPVTAGSVNSSAATGAVTTNVLAWSPAVSLRTVTGYQVSTSGALTIDGYVTAGFVNFNVCNWTGSSLIPGALTLNWRVMP